MLPNLEAIEEIPRAFPLKRCFEMKFFDFLLYIPDNSWKQFSTVIINNRKTSRNHHFT